jgi:drug/metabolite transporter (DMT)-like permease
MEPEAHFIIAEAEADEAEEAAAAGVPIDEKLRVGRFRMDTAWWSTFGLLLVAMSLTVTGELLLKSGINRIGGDLNLSFSTIVPAALKLFSNIFIVGGFAFVFGGALFWLAVLSRWDLSLAYPLLSISYIIGIILSVLILKEKVTLLQVLGVLVIIMGVTLVSIGHEGSRPDVVQ